MNCSFYLLRFGFDPYVLPVTCKESAWSVASDLLTKGGHIVMVPFMWRHEVDTAFVDGARVYDQSGYHVIGAVVASSEKEGAQVRFHEPSDFDCY